MIERRTFIWLFAERFGTLPRLFPALRDFYFNCRRRYDLQQTLTAESYITVKQEWQKQRTDQRLSALYATRGMNEEQLLRRFRLSLHKQIPVNLRERCATLRQQLVPHTKCLLSRTREMACEEAERRPSTELLIKASNYSSLVSFSAILTCFWWIGH